MDSSSAFGMHPPHDTFLLMSNSTSSSSTGALAGSLADLTTILAVIAISVAICPVLIYFGYTRVYKRWSLRQLPVIDTSRRGNRLASLSSDDSVENIVYRRSLSRQNSGSRRSFIEIKPPVRGISIVDLDSIATEIPSASITLLPGEMNASFVSATDSPKRKLKAMMAMNVTGVDLVHIEQLPQNTENTVFDDENLDDSDEEDEEEATEEGSESNRLAGSNPSSSDPTQLLFTSLFATDFTLRNIGLEWIPRLENE
jgi:hypothetical protein